MPDAPEKIDLRSMDVADDKRRQLRQLFPEVFTESSDTEGNPAELDFEKLKAVLGEHVRIAEPGAEKYGLEWPGKRDALKAVQTPALGTLAPCPEESVDWETTKNIFIEGDNLEVLKLLQKSYYGKVKMIYIDPPYNTGNDFVYPDNYNESLDTYLRYTGQISGEGVKLTTNAKDSGRFHSNWLRMMYPRLYVAKNLLREDGVILISIDQNEDANLRILLNQIFGEENFLGVISILSNPRGRQSEKIATSHETLICFTNNAEECKLEGDILSEKELSEYSYVDEKGEQYRLLGLRHRGNASRREDRPLMFFPLYVNPETKSVRLEERDGHTIRVIPKKSTGEDGRWEWGKKTVDERIHLLEAIQVGKEGRWDVCHRDFLRDKEGKEHSKKWKSIWSEKEINYQNGKKEVKSLFDGRLVMDYPKPLALLKKIIEGTTSGDDLIIDFFAGSGTTAHASYLANLRDSGTRRMISIQLPEGIDDNEFKSISTISTERIRRAGAKIRAELEAKAAENEGQLDFDSSSSTDSPTPPDLGFRVFKLAPSNFKRWDGEAAAESEAAVQEQLEAHLDHLAGDASEESILFEILLKAGFELTCPVEKLELAGHPVYSVEDGSLLLCLADRIGPELIDAVAERHPLQFLCLDRALHGDDALKVNALETFRALQPEVRFRTV